MTETPIRNSRYRFTDDEYSYFYNAAEPVFCETKDPNEPVYSLKDSSPLSLEEIEAIIGPL